MLWLLAVLGQRFQEAVALVPGSASGDGGMGLVHDHHLGTGTQEVVAAPVALDEVQAYDSMRISVEHADGVGKVTLQPRRLGSRHRHGRDAELCLQLANPLFD